VEGGGGDRDGAARPTAHRLRLRVRYDEADPMGVANNAVYLNWFSAGRSELLRAVGLPYRERFERRGVFLPVVEVRCRYRRPAPCDAEVVVETTVSRLTPARLDFAYRIHVVDEGEEDGALAAEGETLHAFVDHGGRAVDVRRLDPEIWSWLAARVRVGDGRDVRHSRPGST
jgi:acyl-CoA thioester hydrolase